MDQWRSTTPGLGAAACQKSPRYLAQNFPTLSKLVQHPDSSSCAGGRETLRLEASIFEKGLKRCWLPTDSFVGEKMLDLTSCSSPAFRKGSRAWFTYNGERQVQVLRLQERKMAVRGGKEGMRLEGRERDVRDFLGSGQCRLPRSCKLSHPNNS
jgi:hypothetical protein